VAGYSGADQNQFGNRVHPDGLSVSRRRTGDYATMTVKKGRQYATAM
jgi:hypothetical protein